MTLFDNSWFFQAYNFVIGFWPILWHSAALLSAIGILLLVGFGVVTLERIIGHDAMAYLRRVAFVCAAAFALVWIGMVIQNYSDTKAHKKQEEIARAAAIKQATVSRRRAVRDAARGVCDRRDTDCAK